MPETGIKSSNSAKTGGGTIGPEGAMPCSVYLRSQCSRSASLISAKVSLCLFCPEDLESGSQGGNVVEHMFVLGIDPGLSTLGYGLVESGNPARAHRAGVLRTDKDAPIAERLNELFEGLDDILTETRPDVMAIESVFTNRNLQTAISVGRASGVVMLVAARHQMSVHEYVPTAIKSAVTGNGAANKAGVQAMVAKLLNLSEAPKPADAADALAIALCHLRVAPMRMAR